ncbi:MAG: N-acetylmuramic acid 6-phosphate etherase [Pedosphaera sp.]|nr:N-acetylmuramic acid 6-phosphate etherase [Pedosphaera sp.]
MLGRKILGKTGIVSIAESAVAARARHEVSVARDAGLIPGSSQLSPTESRNSYSRRLSQLSYSAAVRLMLREEGTVAGKLFTKHREIEKAVALIVTAIKSGGRLFYFGAGTSGRLGVLDASECPPTFRTPPDLVQGVIAGGRNALWQAVEGAEDDAPAGAAAVEFRAVSRKDVVVGIAASGRTPFVWGALQAARVRGAMIILVTFNPYLEFKPSLQPDVVIDPDLGPEILTGSTRLKCGTATKLVLNIFTTLAMTRLGKVIGNLMVDLNPSNMKLRDRAVRILRELTGSDEMTARRSLEQERWVVARAWERLRR